MCIIRLLRSQAFIALGALLATPCLAQSSTANRPANDELDEVVITGSRLATGFDMPTPVAMVSTEELAEAAPNSMAEALGQLPKLAGSVQASTSGAGSGASQTNGQSLLNLRQLGQSRTLVLLDGMRMGVTNVVNSVDINIIPQNLVKRVDIVTGGASASYGSDAVAGAVNFVLDTAFEGLKTEVTGGMTTYHDLEQGKVSVAFGKALGSRSRIVAAAEYFKMNGIKYGEETGRYWFDHPTGAWSNPTGVGTPIIIVPDAKSDDGVYGGMITAVQGCTTAACNALVNQQFLPGGVLAPRQFGSFHNSDPNAASFAGGGDGAIVNQPFAPDTKRTSVFLHGEFDASDKVTLWGQASYNRNYTYLLSQVVSQLTTTQFRIFEDNAYLPAAVTQALATTAGTQSFNLTRYDRDFGLQADRGNVVVKRFAVGVKGRVTDRWSFDSAIALQNTLQELDIYVSNLRNMYAASDAVRNQNTNQIVCRSQYYTPTGTFVPAGTGLDPGCVPLNLFGDGAVSPAAAEYVMDWNTADVKLRQTTFDANLRGDFGDAISIGAGPISFATGVNYRHLTADRQVDALSATYLSSTGLRANVMPTGLEGRYGGYQFYNPSPLNGKISVTEGYVEFGIPLLKDVPAFQSLAATLAGRMSDYSQSGVENMWKLGLNWTINDSFRVRGTLSADTRAPSVLELFNSATVTQGRNVFPFSTAVPPIRTSGQNITTGNPNLTPEHARTYTAGIVLSPSALPRFQASIDWYKIKILDQITTPGNNQVIQNCYNGDQSFCKQIIVNGQPITTTVGVTANDFVVLNLKPINAPSGATNSGIDVAAAYANPVGAGNLTVRFSANYLLEVKDPNGCPVGSAPSVTDLVGAIGNACGNYPKITGRITGNYDIGPFGIGITERYIDKGKINPNYVAGVDITYNDVPAIWYTDMNLKYDLPALGGGEGEVFLNVANVLNKDPPVTTSSSRSWIVPTEFGLYDIQGRRYTLGVRYKW